MKNLAKLWPLGHRRFTKTVHSIDNEYCSIRTISNFIFLSLDNLNNLYKGLIVKDAFISLKDIEQELKEMEKIGAILSQKLDLLTQDIKYIFSKIKSCENAELINEYFVILGKMQSTLALLAHRDNVRVSERLWRFMSDFDNFDGVKDYYFNKIKSGEYTF